MVWEKSIYQTDRQTDRPDHYSAALKAGLKQEVSAVGLPWDGAGS